MQYKFFVSYLASLPSYVSMFLSCFLLSDQNFREFCYNILYNIHYNISSPSTSVSPPLSAL
jgi:hypothetical protein